MSKATKKRPVAYRPTRRHSPTLHLVQSSRLAKRLAKALLIGLLLTVIAMALLPWQQTSRGEGSVVAYAPQERRQTIDSPTKGIVARIADGLVEGSEVKQGDFILELQPFAANMVDQLAGQLKELKTKEETARVKAEAYAQNVIGFTEARDFAVSAAQQLVESASAKLDGKQRLVTGYEAKALQARLNFERQNGLARQGLKPAKEVEKLRKEWDVTKAELASVQQDVEALRKELLAKRDQLEEKRRLAQTKIDYARALQQDAVGSVATIRKEIGELEIKQSELDRLTIRAPRDGSIFRMPIYELGQTIKEGQPILTLIPDANQKAVELLINGNDISFVQIGQEVRLQFEGWPAVQMPGGPSVAIGTFSGQGATVDAADDGKGHFRILVTPMSAADGQVDEAGNTVESQEDEEFDPWPSDRYLRQGVRANGWVVLRKVSLGYELWRQLNGFPVIMPDEESSKTKSDKPPKLPK